MDFLETPRFPEPLAAYYTGGPCFTTEIVRLPSGFEQRNAPWSSPLHRYEITSAFKKREELADILAFFTCVRGRWCAFRFKDLADYTSSAVSTVPQLTDQWIGQGDGKQASFQLIKTRRAGELCTVRVIQKPVAGTVQIAVDGFMQENLHVEYSTGMITFAENAIPPAGAVITAGFEFDTPCRLGSDQLLVQYQPGGLGSFSLSMVEVRLPLTVLPVNTKAAPAQASAEEIHA
jgi:uncharacterized protein (TIGR02217 family)